MYAVVKIGGHQYRVSEGDVLFVDRQSNDVDDKISFESVLLTNDDGDVTIGKPVVEGARIEATLLDHVKADKVIVFKKKRRKGYQVKNGHRQPMSQLKIEGISISSDSSTKSEKKETQQTEDQADEQSAAQLSTEMNAKEAIKHIRHTPLDELEGFVPEDEDRVTVLDAWNTKQED